MFAIHARIAFLPVVKGGFGNPKVAAYDLGFFASFVILEGMYDLAFGESGCFHRLNKVKVFPFLISPKFWEGYKQSQIDAYGRTLAYVYLSDGSCLNELMIAEGFVKPYNRFFCSELPKYQELSNTAKIKQKGLFSIVQNW
jgi:hypothetical protein